MVDNERFIQIKDQIVGVDRQRFGIGTMSEKNVHAIVKNYYEPDEDRQEIPLEGCIADIYRNGEVYEIQNGNFNRLRTKLDRFLPKYKVNIVYPIPYKKWLHWIDQETGQISEKHKSPKTGSPYEALWELYKIKKYIKEPNLNLILLMLDIEEYRLLNGYSKDKKKGSERFERIPFFIEAEYIFEQIQDYMQLIPIELGERFTSKDYAKATKLTIKKATTAVNVLSYIGVIKKIGNVGRAYLYEVTDK